MTDHDVGVEQVEDCFVDAALRDGFRDGRLHGARRARLQHLLKHRCGTGYASCGLRIDLW